MNYQGASEGDSSQSRRRLKSLPKDIEASPKGTKPASSSKNSKPYCEGVFGGSKKIFKVSSQCLKVSPRTEKSWIQTQEENGLAIQSKEASSKQLSFKGWKLRKIYLVEG